jgi:hypothetical protein
MLLAWFTSVLHRAEALPATHESTVTRLAAAGASGLHFFTGL